MTDWSEYLVRGRRKAETLFWLVSASVVALAVLATAALATWLDLTAGKDNALENAVLVELDSLPPVEALAEIPEVPQPEAVTDLPDELEPEPVVEDTPPEMTEDTPPEPEVAPEPPKPEVADALPQVAPEPPPVQKAEVKPEPKPKPLKKPKPVRKAETKPEPQAKPQESQAGRAGSQAPKGAATASQRAKWHARVQGQLARQLKKKSFGAKGLTLSLLVTVNGSGAITGITLAGSSGNTKIDNAVLAQARRLGSVAAPPDGKGDRLKLPVTVQ